MALKNYCDRLIKPSYIIEEEPEEPLVLDPLQDYLDEGSTQDIANEIQDLIDSTIELPTGEVTDLDGNTDANRNAERIIVTRQELRRTAYVQQLIKDAKNAIKRISNLNVDLQKYNLKEAKEAIEILTGREDEVLYKLRNALTQQLDSKKEIDWYIEYVRSLL